MFRATAPDPAAHDEWITGPARASGGVLNIRCTEPIERPRSQQALDFRIFGVSGFRDGGTTTHVQTRGGIDIAHAGLAEDIRFESQGDLFLAGSVTGENPKVGRLTLEHPAGQETWTFLPPPGFLADEWFEHEGGPGSYTLSYTALHPGPLVGMEAIMVSFEPVGA